MATSVASGSGQLHFQEAFFRGHGCRQAYSIRNIAVPLCIQKELSWYVILNNLTVMISGDFNPFKKNE